IGVIHDAAIRIGLVNADVSHGHVVNVSHISSLNEVALSSLKFPFYIAAIGTRAYGFVRSATLHGALADDLTLSPATRDRCSCRRPNRAHLSCRGEVCFGAALREDACHLPVSILQ